MITAMSLTNGTLTVIRDNGAEILTARNDHPRWNDIVEAYKSRNEERLTVLLSLKAVVEEYSIGQLTINSTGVLFRGNPLHSVDAERVMAFLRDGLPYKPIANYISRKMANPSARAITELYNFLEHKNMPITDEGKIIAYKGVQNTFFSVMGNTNTVVLQGETDSGGHIRNVIGATIEIERSSCDDDFRNGCSFGLHAGSLSYAKGWGERVLLVEIDPADVVSVPEDCSCQKLRCCKYRVLGEYSGPMPHSYTNEFSSPSEGKDTGECQNVVEPAETVTLPDTSTSSNVDPRMSVKGLSNPVWDDIAKKVREFLAEQFCIKEADIKNDSLCTDLGMDSLDGVELTMALEEHFNREVSDEEAEKLGTKPFSEIVDYIYQQQSLGTNDDNSFQQGYIQGEADRLKSFPPKFLNGDENAADSPQHANYMRGYLSAYS